MAKYKPTNEMTTEELLQYWNELTDEANLSIEKILRETKIIRARLDARKSMRREDRDE